MQWQINDIESSFHHIVVINPHIVVCIDASLTDGVLQIITLHPEDFGINQDWIISISISKFLNNTITYPNNMGWVKSKFCNEIALRTWEFCIARKL